MVNKVTPPGKMVDIGTHKLHVISDGENATNPTVVFEHGAGASALTWSLVYSEISKIAKVFAYDRAGYGWSGAGPLPRTNERCVDELHELLIRENIKGPIILVGHSYGGINARLFADKYPEKVKGMVLVDATHEDEVTDRFPIEHRKGQEMAVKMFGILASLSKIGILPLLSSFKAIPGFSKSIDKFTSEDQKKLWQTSFRYQAIFTAKNEFAHLNEGYRKVRTAQRLDHIPLTVVAAGIVEQFIPGTSNDVKESIRQLLQEVAKETSELSNNGSLVVAEKSSHNVHMDQPDIVIKVIKDMINSLELHEKPALCFNS